MRHRRQNATGLVPAVVAGALLFACEMQRRVASGEPPSEPAPAPATLRAGVTLESEDATLRLFAPDGSLLVESDGVNGRHGPEGVSLVSDRAGVYTLEVLAVEAAPEGAPGRFSVRVDPGVERALPLGGLCTAGRLALA